MSEDVKSNGASAGADSPQSPVRHFSQDGYAVVEYRTAALPITLGFELTTWEAQRRMEELRSAVGKEFFQEMQIVRAKLRFSLPNVGSERSQEAE